MSILTTIDVAHPSRRPDAVEEDLLQGWTRVRNSREFRILKIIHGYGSGGKGGATKEVVLNWVFRNRKKFRAIIKGEEYSLQSVVVQEMRREVGQYADPDLDADNQGVTVVWVW